MSQHMKSKRTKSRNLQVNIKQKTTIVLEQIDAQSAATVMAANFLTIHFAY